MTDETLEVRCCIAGGGPAGVMLGFLLARAGIDVVVLEKHADFFRDFRGDTIHPSTLQVMHELGVLDAFLRRPHQRVETLAAQVGGHAVTIADFRHLPTQCRYVAFMPQWEFLDFLAGQGRLHPGFVLRMQTEATGLVEAAGRVAGVRARTARGTLTVRADLVVAADGRSSTLRTLSGLPLVDLGAPMDVLWMRVSRRADDPAEALGRAGAGRILVTIDRGNYWQCAYVIPKGGFDELRTRGIGALHDGITALAPYLTDRMAELPSWDHVSLLSVAVNRLTTWYRLGLLCIGDAAHAMSPIGGVGVNLAVQDAVAAANILAPHLRQGAPGEDVLRQVQARRAFPTRAMHFVQVTLQKQVIARVLATDRPLDLPFPLRMLQRFPVLRRLPGRLIGLGFRPEHVAGATHW